MRQTNIWECEGFLLEFTQTYLKNMTLKWLTCFGSYTKKVLKVFMCIWRRKSQIQTYFDSQSHSSYYKNKSVKTSVPKLCWILPVFLTYQNFWRWACTPATPPPTPLSKLASRLSNETPSVLFMVLNTSTQQTRLLLECSIGVARGPMGHAPQHF